MILPPNVASSDAYMDPYSLATEHQLSYLLSFESDSTSFIISDISEKAIHYSPKDMFSSSLQSFNFVNFTEEAYNKLLNDSQKELNVKTHDIVKATRSGFKEYFLRVSSQTLNACLYYQNFCFMAQNDNILHQNDFLNDLKNENKIEEMKGSIPSKWPEGLKDFNNQLKKTPILAFYNEAEPILEQFIENIKSAITTLLKSPRKQDFLDLLFLQLQVLIGITIRTGNCTEITSMIDFIIKLQSQITAEENTKIASEISKYFSQLLHLIDEIQKQPKLQYQHRSCDLGAFEIMKKCHFFRDSYYNNTMATDGQFIYLYISTINGGMFKIGTGHNNIAGKVYLHLPVNTGKADEVSWVYLKGKLYLRTNAKECRNIDIINPDTFKVEGSIQLHCPEMFGHTTTQNINKNYPFLTDGDHLYIIGKRLSVEKIESKHKEEKVEEVPPAPVVPEQPENEKQRRRKQKALRKKKKGPEQNVLKLLEYVLYEFDIHGEQSNENFEETMDKDLMNQLYESFNGYFSKSECSRALSLHKQDIASAATWLVDEGEKERTKRTYTVSKTTVLAQVEVTNDAQGKALRNIADIAIKQDSILQIYQISDCIWTCSKEQVACYTEHGIKIFSKNPADYKPIHTKSDNDTQNISVPPNQNVTLTPSVSDKQKQKPKKIKQSKEPQNVKQKYKEIKQQKEHEKKYKLKGTYITTIDNLNRKINKLPFYNIVYDNKNHLYYTFLWTNEHHSFPSTITVSRDYLEHQQHIIRQRPENLEVEEKFKSLTSIGINLLKKLALIEEYKLRLPSKPNNWLYIYSSIVIDLNNQIKNLKDNSQKKKLSTKRSKIINKMNKILDITGLHKKQKQYLETFNQSIREIKPEYAFGMNGRIQTLQLINSIFKQKPEYQGLYFYLLELWVLNAEIITFPYHQYLVNLGNELLAKLKSKKLKDNYDNLLKVLIKGFKIFFRTQQQQLEFFLHIQGLELLDLITTHFKIFSTKTGIKESHIEEITEKQIPEKYDFNTDFEQIYLKKEYLDLTHSKQVSNIGLILLNKYQTEQSINKNKENKVKKDIVRLNEEKPIQTPHLKELKQKFNEKVIKGLQEGNQQILILYKYMVASAVNLTHKDSDDIVKLIIETLKTIEQVLTKTNFKNQINVLKLLSFIISVYSALPTVLVPSSEIQQLILNILQILLKPEVVALLNSVHLYKFQGISQTLEKTFETNHPYERGKTQSFQTQNFTNAIFVTVEFDRRCQSDPNHDILSIYASSQSPPVQNQQRQNSNDKFVSHLRMSGKNHNKTPYLLLGNSILMDFVSSGHAKDEHSLNRFGFKFGLRPSYSGKIEYEKNDLETVVSKFGSKDVFEQYVFILKQLVVVSSNLAENMLIQKEIQNEDKLIPYLDGKIFQQGFEESFVNVSQDELKKQIIKGFFKKQHKDKFNFIAKGILQSNYTYEEEKKQNLEDKKKENQANNQKQKQKQQNQSLQKPKETVAQNEDDCWDLNGIPQYLKKEIEEIKKLNGNFINLFLEARSQVKNSTQYGIETKRTGFTEHYKNLWLKGEALLFLTVLKHSGLLHLSLKFSIQYIKQNLQAFQQARNNVFNSFIFRMQLEKRWQDLLTTYHDPPQEEQKQEQAEEVKKEEKVDVKDKKHNVIVKKTGKKVAIKIQKKKSEVQKEVVKEKKKRVKMNPEVIIRQRLSVPSTTIQLNKYKQIPFDEEDNYFNVTQIINKIKLQKPSDKSVYLAPAYNLIRSCLFLLKLRSSNSTVQNPTAELKPLGVYRSFSQVDEKKINKDKVVVFREWLENWKKWKGFKKQEEKVELKFPVREIVSFITGWVNIKDVQDLMVERHRQINQRINMINYTNSITKIVSGTLLEKYILGVMITNLKDGYMSNISGTSEEIRKLLQTAVNQYQQTLHSIYEAHEKKLPLNLAKFQAEIQQPSYLIPKIKSIALNNLLLCSDMINTPLSMALFYSSFKMVSNVNEELIQISNKIVCKSLLSSPSVQYLISVIQRQVGKDTLSMKRWKDPIFIERLLLLLFKVEKMVRKDNIQFQDKVKLSAPLFYIVYHIESSLINKIALRILKMLKIPNRTQISTPFGVKYLQIKQQSIGENKLRLDSSVVEFEDNRDANNWELLTERCAQNTFRKPEPIQQRLLEKTEESSKYHLILNLSSEEDIAWILRVLYYLEEIYPTAKSIASWEEYVATKATKEDKNNANNPNTNPNPLPVPVPNPLNANLNINANINVNIPVVPVTKRDGLIPPIVDGTSLRNDARLSEKIFANCPTLNLVIDPKIQQQLPIGWFLVYNNCYSKYQLPKQNSKRQVQAKIVKKQNQRKNWQSVALNNLIKKFEDLNAKPLQEPKQTDPIQDKTQFIAAKNFITKMRKLIVDTQQLLFNFINYGYVVFGENLEKQKLRIICELFQLGKTNRLQPIKVDLTKKDYKTKLTPNEPNVPSTSDLSLSIVKSTFENTFQYLIDYNNQCSGRDNCLTEINKIEIVMNDSQLLDWTELAQIDEGSSSDMKLGKLLVETGWFQQKRKMNEVEMVGYQDNLCTIVQGGIESGIKKTTVLLNNDPVLTTQQVAFDNLIPYSPDIVPDNDSDILEELNKKIDLQPITTTNDLTPYFQLKMLLQKAIKIDWENYDAEQLKQITQKLNGLSKIKTKSKKTVKQMEQELMKLMLKLFDTNVESLDLIQFYEPTNTFDQKLHKFMIQTPEKKYNTQFSQKGQNYQNYYLQNSSYIRSVQNQPPPVEKNKLLRYWDKNIIPRILDFVKTTLRQLEIDEFFEQMRIPLRKGDQNEATKIAYVICDNKLPPGAVLPDANHDWSTLSIQQVSIGQYVLLKLPKQISQSSTPLLNSKTPQQFSMVQIIFIDQRNNNLLIRHRISNYSVVHYFWVSITSILPLQTPIKIIKSQEIFKNSEEYLNGLISSYSKQVLTKINQSSDIIELIKQNILDLFINDPIEGWLHHNQQWSIQNLLEKELGKSNNKLIEFISKNLQPFKTYSTNLYTKQFKQLNLFQNITSLILMFDKKSKLTKCTGVRFYNDETGINEIQHIYSGNTSEKNYFEPLIFKQPKIYSLFYNNLESSTNEQPNQGNEKADDNIPVLVFGIEPIWTIAGFLAEKISQIGTKENNYTLEIKQLIKIYVDWILKPGSFILKSIAAQLVTKMIKRLVSIYNNKSQKITLESLGLSQKDIEQISKIIKEMQIQQSADSIIVLYEDYLQNMIEMLATLLSNIKCNIEMPKFINSVIDTISFNKFIRGEPANIPPIDNDMSAQWQRILVIDKLPSQLPGKEIRSKVIEIMSQNKARILTPHLDIYYENDSLVALVDGWDIVDLVEEQIIEKIEEQEEKEPEEQANLMIWACPECTVENAAGNVVCECCETPYVPQVPKPDETLEKVQQVNLNQAAEKLKQKEAKRFLIVKEKIQEYITQYWKSQIEKVNKQNKQIQAKNLQKQESRKKRQERELKRKKDKKQGKQVKQEEPIPFKQIPKILEYNIVTGSEALSYPIIQKFLQRRLIPCDSSAFITKLLQSENKSELSSLQKFKFLETKGIDLWGVKVIDLNANILPYQLLILLMKYVQTEICKETSSVLSYNPNSIRLISQSNNLHQSDKQVAINFRVQSDTGTIIKYKKLAQCKPQDIRFSWYIIKSYNNYLSQSLPFIQLDSCKVSELQRTNIQKLSIDSPLGDMICSIRQLIMCSIKFELLQKVMQKTSISRDHVPRIVIERLKIKEGEKNLILSSKQKDEFILSKAYEQAKAISSTQFRPFKPKGAQPYVSFQVSFKGENVQGQGGPYRQFFTDISNELHPSKRMGLFIPTPNNLHQTGESRSKSIINPKATNSYQLSLFEFLGMLMGCSVRTGAHLALDLPPMLWKQLVGQNVVPTDLIEVDEKFYEMTKQILECPSEAEFQQIDEISGEPLYWIVSLSDGTQVELIKNGAKTKVLYKQRHKYVTKLLQTRLKQSMLQVKSIRKGLSLLVPQPLLNCLSGQDIEVYVCGRPKVDVLLLKRHTKYSGQFHEELPLIKMFWNVLFEMTQPERLKFIKFCWGQQRLPINSEEFQRNNIRFMIKPQINSNNPDGALPRADTCFFNIELPKYTTKEIMRKNIIIAITTDSDSMNAEQHNEDNPLIYAGENSSYDEDGGGQ